MPDKIIGTSVPLFSLKSKLSEHMPNGTINDGFLLLDWLHRTNQKAWQLLPFHQTHLSTDSQLHVPSPYKSYGYGIDPRYIPVGITAVNPQHLEEFKVNNNYWLKDYSLFCALRDHFKTDDWRKWDEELITPSIKTKEKWTKKLKKNIERNINQQYILHTRYRSMKNYARKLGILLLGDMQFYLPFNSPVTWSNQQLFCINDERNMDLVSGVPNKKGVMYGRQIWGHPLYNWSNTLDDKIIQLFINRLRYLSELFDMVRIDHASGFFRYGVINLKNQDQDEMKTGPGNHALATLIMEAVKLGIKIFAEDAGYDLGGLRNLMDSLNIPGVRVLRCAYDENNDLFISDHADLNVYPANTVVYTSTHDTETLLGYVKKLNSEQRRKLTDRLKIENIKDDYKMVVKLRNIAINSNVNYVIIPIQDWFFSTERINIPGTESINQDTNWCYRMEINIEDLPLVGF